ncbi:hypothetical protein OO015_07005 [Thermomicrobium sp. 4228-Ro]|uniref:hypothetical protein n=1 Tax=Thermomicrobium sp. 4228-Ro TaxID=2993937 RepID=UPI0022490687|nr:hypothetical protein [Thermomicrobium sp. 4228-Ro]MCX2727245.1 hypothetical protein [Thermomicrobium sp. 4228-Ro]
MIAWALTMFVCGLWWTAATVWRLSRPRAALPLWLALTRDLAPAPLLGMLLARSLGLG